MKQLRRFYWRYVCRYAYEICDCCGRPVASRLGPMKVESTDWLNGRKALAPWTYWVATAELWEGVNGQVTGILCPLCFTRKALDKGIFVHWEAAIDSDVIPVP